MGKVVHKYCKHRERKVTKVVNTMAQRPIMQEPSSTLCWPSWQNVSMQATTRTQHTVMRLGLPSTHWPSFQKAFCRLSQLLMQPANDLETLSTSVSGDSSKQAACWCRKTAFHRLPWLPSSLLGSRMQPGYVTCARGRQCCWQPNVPKEAFRRLHKCRSSLDSASHCTPAVPGQPSYNKLVEVRITQDTDLRPHTLRHMAGDCSSHCQSNTSGETLHMWMPITMPTQSKRITSFAQVHTTLRLCAFCVWQYQT
jgi:hypothetical protein